VVDPDATPLGPRDPDGLEDTLSVAVVLAVRPSDTLTLADNDALGVLEELAPGDSEPVAVDDRVCKATGDGDSRLRWKASLTGHEQARASPQTLTGVTDAARVADAAAEFESEGGALRVKLAVELASTLAEVVMLCKRPAAAALDRSVGSARSRRARQPAKVSTQSRGAASKRQICAVG